APDGKQVAFLQGTGTITQVAGFAEAGVYSLSFQAAQRDRNNPNHQTFQVLVDDIVVGAFTPTGADYQRYTADSFLLTAGSHLIRLVGLNPQGGDNTAFIDDFQVTKAAPNRVSGVVFSDRNSNGRQDPGEAPLPGYAVAVVGANGRQTAASGLG